MAGIDQIARDANGAPVGRYRLRHESNLNMTFPGGRFVGGIAEDVDARAALRVISGFGSAIADVVRIDGDWRERAGIVKAEETYDSMHAMLTARPDLHEAWDLPRDSEGKFYIPPVTRYVPARIEPPKTSEEWAEWEQAYARATDALTPEQREAIRAEEEVLFAKLRGQQDPPSDGDKPPEETDPAKRETDPAPDGDDGVQHASTAAKDFDRFSKAYLEGFCAHIGLKLEEISAKTPGKPLKAEIVAALIANGFEAKDVDAT